MVTLNLYQTKITASDYNPSIDDSITVTVTLLDFNGNAVTGTNATIEVNQGYFTKYTRNSTDTSISGTSTKSYTGTTGSNGSFTMTYKCSEWGLATFSANTSKIQCKITGWKMIQSLSQNSKLYVNKDLKLAIAYINWDSYTFGNTDAHIIQDTSEFPAIPSEYRPNQVIHGIGDNKANIKIWMSTSGVVSGRVANAGTVVISGTLIWSF